MEIFHDHKTCNDLIVYKLFNRQSFGRYLCIYIYVCVQVYRRIKYTGPMNRLRGEDSLDVINVTCLSRVVVSEFFITSYFAPSFHKKRCVISCGGVCVCVCLSQMSFRISSVVW